MEMPNTVLGDASRLIPELTARNLGENARVGSGIRNYEEKTRKNLDSNCMDIIIAFNIYI